MRGGPAEDTYVSVGGSRISLPENLRYSIFFGRRLGRELGRNFDLNLCLHSSL